MRLAHFVLAFPVEVWEMIAMVACSAIFVLGLEGRAWLPRRSAVWSFFVIAIWGLNITALYFGPLPVALDKSLFHRNTFLEGALAIVLRGRTPARILLTALLCSLPMVLYFHEIIQGQQNCDEWRRYKTDQDLGKARRRLVLLIANCFWMTLATISMGWIVQWDFDVLAYRVQSSVSVASPLVESIPQTRKDQALASSLPVQFALPARDQRKDDALNSWEATR